MKCTEGEFLKKRRRRKRGIIQVCSKGSREKSPHPSAASANTGLPQPAQGVSSKTKIHAISTSFRDHCKAQKGWEETLELVSWKVTRYASHFGASGRGDTWSCYFLWSRTRIWEGFSFLASTGACELGMTKICLPDGKIREPGLMLVQK